MPLVATRGAASAQGFGEFAQSAAPVYIEDVFSTNLWTTTNTSQVITNNIDMTKGALTWLKSRSYSFNHILQTAAGNSLATAPVLCTDLTSAAFGGNYRIADSTTGFTVGADMYTGTPGTAVAWTFRKQPKFFDVVTWTGNGAGTRTIAHSLGSQPGAIFLKRTDASGAWAGAVKNAIANSYWAGEGSSTRVFTTEASGSNTASDGFVGWTSTDFKPTSFGFNGTEYNINGATYVAYIFAHDAGGFGLTGTDNVISCGSFTTDGIGVATVSLGYEPQWLMWKASSQAGNWLVLDNMRGWTNGGNDSLLRPNTSDAESTGGQYGHPTATGFDMQNMAASTTYIYIAIRRGPMKTPTTGTSVFSPTTASSEPQSTPLLTGGSFPSDMVLHRPRYTLTSYGFYNTGRLTGGGTSTLETFSTVAAYDFGSPPYWKFDNSTAAYIPANGYFNNNGEGSIGYALYSFRRAPGFFDVVCYTGTGSNLTLNHNLGVAPELMIIKARSASSPWAVYAASEGINKTADLNRGDLGFYTETGRWLATPTATQFSVKPGATLNSAGQTQVAYLFASAAGVSKVGSYTGTGALQTVNCGFTGGARFVLIKRADSAGDWYVYDSARGITSGNDPYLLLNSTAAQVTGTNYVDTTSVGFQVTAAAPAGLNANGGSYIFLAIA